jgi:hypothetical protein
MRKDLRMADMDSLLQDLKQKRGELAVQIKLGSMEAKQEWEKLEKKFEEFRAKSHLDKTAEDVGEALALLGDELKKGYERLKKAL